MQGLLGYLNRDAEIMQETAEYEREKEKQKELTRQALEKEQRAYNREIIKKNYDQNSKTFLQYQKDVTSGKIKPLSLSYKGHVYSGDEAFKINQAYILKGLPPPFVNLTNQFEVLGKSEKFGTMIGSGAYAFNFHSKFQNEKTYENAIGLLREVSTLSRNKDELERFKNAPAATKEKMKGLILTAQNMYENLWHRKNIGERAPDTAQKYPPKSDYTEEIGMFFGIDNIKNVLGVNTTEDSKNKEAVELEFKNRTEESVSNNTNEKHQVYVQGLGGFSYDHKDAEKGLDIVAKIVPYKTKDNPKYMYAGQEFLNAKDIKSLTITDPAKIKLFNRAVKVASMPGAEGMDPDSRLYQYDKDDILKFHKAVYNKKDGIEIGDINKAAAVLMPIMAAPDEDVRQSYSNKFIDKTGVEYMFLRRYGSTAVSDKAKMELRKTYEAQKTSLLELGKLREKVDDINEVAAYSNFKRIIIGAFNINEGFLGNFINEFRDQTPGLKTNGTQYEDGRTSITQNYLNGLQQRIKDANARDKTGLAAEIEALKISLAFKLARAADPSGRLSNQDIDLQLRRLGGQSFATREYAVRQITMVYNDLKREQDTLEIFVKYGSNTNKLTKNQARYIDGVFAASYLHKKYLEYTNPSATGEVSSDALITVNKSDLNKDKSYKAVSPDIFNPGLYVFGENFYEQQGQTEDGNSITLKKVLKKDEEGILKKYKK